MIKCGQQNRRTDTNMASLFFFAISLIIYLFKYDDEMFAESEMFVNVMRLVRMEGL